MPSWLVTGATGMLGRDLCATLRSAGESVTALGRQELDITDRPAVTAAVEGHDVVVNLAGWTKVDDAETNEQEAHQANAVGPARVAEACRVAGARLVHLSTDYVFDGRATSPYSADHPTDPQNVYGRTKRDGELAVRSLLPDASMVVRTSWLYGEHGPSFVTTIARLATEREQLDVVADQTGQPTWTCDVAELIRQLVLRDARPGVYHATNSGQTTWFGLAQAVLEELGMAVDRVRPVSSDAFPRPAPRPAYSVLSHDTVRRAGVTPPRAWREALSAAAPTVLAPWLTRPDRTPSEPDERLLP